MAERTLLNWESRSKKEDGEKVKIILSPVVFFLTVCFIQGAKLTISDILEAVQGFLQPDSSCFPSFPWYYHLNQAGFNAVQKLFTPTALLPPTSREGALDL